MVTDMEIDLTLYSNNDLDKEVSCYYDNLTHLKEVYGESWKQIVAEIIAEQNTEDRISFEKFEDVMTYLQKKYQHSFSN